MRALTKILLVAGLLAIAGCLTTGDLHGDRSLRPDSGAKPRRYVLEVTGYCACQECCSWHRNWLFTPVNNSDGRRKKVGFTASGTRARPGTLAADTANFPFGTIMYIPGYGYGRVEDRGGAIKGWKLDCYFESHEEAQEWGRHKRYVDVWLPQDSKR